MDVLGCRGHGGTPKQGKKGIFRPSRSAMTGEISPNMMFCVCFSKMVKNGFRWVRMDAYGRNKGYAHGGKQTKAKKSPNCRAEHVFACMTKARNKQELGNEGI